MKDPTTILSVFNQSCSLALMKLSILRMVELVKSHLSASKWLIWGKKNKVKKENKSSFRLIICPLQQQNLIWPPTFIWLLTWFLLQLQKLFLHLLCLLRNRVGLLAYNDSCCKVNRVSWSATAVMCRKEEKIKANCFL